MEIMQAFHITRDLTKKIDTVKPTNQSELLAITGFPSNYFDDTDCKQVTYWGQKSSQEIMKEQEASSHADASGSAPRGSSNDQNDPGNLRKMIMDMQSHQDKLTRQFEESQKEIHSLRMSLSGMTMRVSQTCTDIKKSVDKLQGALVDPTVDSSEGEDSESEDSGNNGHCRKDPQFDQLASNVSQLISSREQGFTHIPGPSHNNSSGQSRGSDCEHNSTSKHASQSKRRMLPIPQHVPEYTLEKTQRNPVSKPRRPRPHHPPATDTGEGHLVPPPPVVTAPLTSGDLLKQIKLPKFTGSGGVSWSAFISVLESRAARHYCNEADMLELLEGSLDGEAFQYYGDLPFRELQTYGDLRNGLEQRFGQRVSSKARRAELHSMHQDPGEDLYKYSSRIAKIAAEGYSDLPLHQRAEMEIETFLRGCNDQEQAAWLIHHRFPSINAVCNAMHSAQQNTRFLNPNKSIKAVRFSEESETEKQIESNSASVCKTSMAESSIDKLCQDVDSIRRDVSDIKSSRQSRRTESHLRTQSPNYRGRYTGNSPASAGNYRHNYHSRGRSPSPVNRNTGSPWKRDQIPTAQHYGNRGDTPPRRYNYPDSPHRGREGYGSTGSPMRRPSNDRYADHYHKREQRDVSIPRHRSYENRSYDNGRRMLEHNNSDEKYVTSVRQLGMEETPPTSLDKCDQFAETSDPPHAEDDEARYHHEEDHELSLNY